MKIKKRVYDPNWNTDFIPQLPDQQPIASRERSYQVFQVTDPDKRVCRNESIKGRARYQRMLAKRGAL